MVEVAGKHQGERNIREQAQRVFMWCVCIVGLVIQSANVSYGDGLPDHNVGGKVAPARSFAECARQEGQILKSYPAQCVTKDGKVFVDNSTGSDGSCKDLCGDGRCQQIVCMAIGCPCPESTTSCPKDCK